MKTLAKVHAGRITDLNEKEIQPEGDYILYWMQQSQRLQWNHALAYALRLADQLEKPLLVGFGLMAGYPEANLRHYTFMLEGLQEVARELEAIKVAFVLRLGPPDKVANELAQKACAVVCDRGYLRHQQKWREKVARTLPCRLVQVEADLVVPVQTASDKREYAARTIRKKLMGQFEDFLEEPDLRPPRKEAGSLEVGGELLEKPGRLLDRLDLDRSVPAVSDHFKGGTSEAVSRFGYFLEEQLSVYDEHRNQAQTDDTSHMSPYLHFGQVSPAWLLKKVRRRRSMDNVNAFVEELLVRRELAANFCFFTPDQYDSYHCLPEWAQKTLEAHKDDAREHVYTREEMEQAQTHDPAWNAAMQEMRYTGYMHNYMRMYWGKRILAWTNTPRYAYQTALYLNNKYFLDGRDCSSFANVAWLFGLHDRAWQERPVFGKVRIMTSSGLERKFDTQAYIDKVADRRPADED